ncbi:DUF2971 domain-containing protein [Mesorhizobium sp.]|uniref:DUF2971 domain-containing protein n=1 Tax=Mesorhizobium sp. TaxID=1871066 RepID=UPI000FE84C98|nr:DUF2971 domain-containing protein [Mesorhizobium sp.]RWP54344.1 MAG: DUF2971 domain-containing protein [Mesorhizobium sp.]
MSLLYKYRAFSSPEQQNRLFATLADESFWFPIASEVNDPFEFRCAVDFGGDLEETSHAFAWIERMLNPSFTDDQALAKARDVIARVPRPKLRERQWELSFNLWRQLASSVTLCCFAGTAVSTLMWSHYAGGHSGVAIEVEPIGLEHLMFPVAYSDEIPRVSPIALVDVEAAMKGSLFNVLFLRKAKCWEYEREYRIMRTISHSHADSFKRGSIKRVVIGCAMPQESRHRLLQWMKANTPHIGVAVALPSEAHAYTLEVADA